METKPPVPPFTADSARQKIRLAEDAWNSRDPARVALVYTADTRWRNRAEFPVGRDEVQQFLARKWEGTGLPADQGIVGLRRQSHRGALCL